MKEDIKVKYKSADKNEYYVIQKIESYVLEVNDTGNDDEYIEHKCYLSKLKLREDSFSYDTELRLNDEVRRFEDYDSAEEFAYIARFIHDAHVESTKRSISPASKIDIEFVVKKVTTTVK